MSRILIVTVFSKILFISGATCQASTKDEHCQRRDGHGRSQSSKLDHFIIFFSLEPKSLLKSYFNSLKSWSKVFTEGPEGKPVINIGLKSGISARLENCN